MQQNKQQSIYKKQPAVSKLLKKFPCSVQCFIPHYPGPDKPNPCPYYLLFPKPIFISIPTVRATLPSHFTYQYNSGSNTIHKATLYITLGAILFCLSQDDL